MERTDFAMNLIDERERLGYSRKNFAEQANVSAESLRLYESGQSNVPSDFLMAAAQLGMDVQFLLTGVRSANLNLVSQKFDTEYHERTSNTTIENQINGNVSHSVIASSGSVVTQIHTTSHTTKTIAEVKPGKEHIDNEQAHKLQELVQLIYETEKAVKKNPKSKMAIWASLNAHCKVPRYRLIALSDFAKAEMFLRKWHGRLTSMPSAQKKDGDWRKKRYSYIKVNLKKFGFEDWFNNYLKEKFSVSSISQLTDSQLQQAYTAVSNKKSRQGGR